MIADALSDRLLRALSRRLHGHPRHRIPRLEHPFPRLREQLPARPRAGRHRRRGALAARGSGRGNRCAAGQFRRRFADGRLPGAGRRPARHAAGGHAARGRADELPPADGYVASAAHPGRPDVLTAWMDAVRRRRERPHRNRSRPRPVRRTQRSAVQLRSSSSATAPHRSPATTPSPTGPKPNSNGCARPASPTGRSPCMRTWADPRMVDPTLEPTKRPPNMCYAGVPVKANRSAHGIAAACTLRNWLGMWSLRHAQTRAEPHLARIDCPALVINAETGHRRVSPPTPSASTTRSPAPTRRCADRHRPLLHHSGSPQREGRYDRQVDREAVARESPGPLRSRRQGPNNSLRQSRIGSTSGTAPKTTTTPSTANCPTPR